MFRAGVRAESCAWHSIMPRAVGSSAAAAVDPRRNGCLLASPRVCAVRHAGAGHAGVGHAAMQKGRPSEGHHVWVAQAGISPSSGVM